MRKRFGRQYEAWAKEANLFFPRIKKIDKSNFNIAFYMKNREYRVLFFSLFVTAVLIVKFLKKIEFFGTHRQVSARLRKSRRGNCFLRADFVTI